MDKTSKIFELKKYGIVSNSKSIAVEVWGTGKPRREFL